MCDVEFMDIFTAEATFLQPRSCPGVKSGYSSRKRGTKRPVHSPLAPSERNDLCPSSQPVTEDDPAFVWAARRRAYHTPESIPPSTFCARFVRHKWNDPNHKHNRTTPKPSPEELLTADTPPPYAPHLRAFGEDTLYFIQPAISVHPSLRTFCYSRPSVLDHMPSPIAFDPVLVLRHTDVRRVVPALGSAPRFLFSSFVSTLSHVRSWTTWRTAPTDDLVGACVDPMPEIDPTNPHWPCVPFWWASLSADQQARVPTPAPPTTYDVALQLWLNATLRRTPAWSPPGWKADVHGNDPAYSIVNTLVFRLDILHRAHKQLNRLCQSQTSTIPQDSRNFWMRAVGLAMNMHLPLAVATEEAGIQYASDGYIGGDVLLCALPHPANPNIMPSFEGAPSIASILTSSFIDTPSNTGWIDAILPKGAPRHLAFRNIMMRMGKEIAEFPDTGDTMRMHIFMSMLLPALLGDMPASPHAPLHVTGLAWRLHWQRLMRPCVAPPTNKDAVPATAFIDSTAVCKTAAARRRRAECLGRMKPIKNVLTQGKEHRLYQPLSSWFLYCFVALHPKQNATFNNEALVVSALASFIATHAAAIPHVNLTFCHQFDWESWAALRGGSMAAARRMINDHPDLPFLQTCVGIHIAMRSLVQDAHIGQAVFDNAPFRPDRFSQFVQFIRNRLSGREHTSTRFLRPTTTKGPNTSNVRLSSILAKCPDLRSFRRAVLGLKNAGLLVRQHVPAIVSLISNSPADFEALQILEQTPSLTQANILYLSNCLSPVGASVYKLLAGSTSRRICVISMPPSWGRFQEQAIRDRYNVTTHRIPETFAAWSVCPFCQKVCRETVAFSKLFMCMWGIDKDVAIEWRNTYIPRQGHAVRPRFRRPKDTEASPPSEIATSCMYHARLGAAHAFNRQHGQPQKPRKGRTYKARKPRKRRRTTANASVPTERPQRNDVLGSDDSADDDSDDEDDEEARTRRILGMMLEKQNISIQGDAEKRMAVTGLSKDGVGALNEQFATSFVGCRLFPSLTGRQARQRLRVLTNEGSNNKCPTICEDCGLFPEWTKTCKTCMGRGVRVHCDAKYHCGSSKTKLHCNQPTTTVLALGTILNVNGIFYFICPMEGCGLPARYDPCSSTVGTMMCALCHLKKFLADRSARHRKAMCTRLPRCVVMQGVMPCLRCGVRVQAERPPPVGCVLKAPRANHGYMYQMMHAGRRQYVWTCICWKCWAPAVHQLPASTFVSEAVMFINKRRKNAINRYIWRTAAGKRMNIRDLGLQPSSEVVAPPTSAAKEPKKRKRAKWDLAGEVLGSYGVRCVDAAPENVKDRHLVERVHFVAGQMAMLYEGEEGGGGAGAGGDDEGIQPLDAAGKATGIDLDLM